MKILQICPRVPFPPHDGGAIAMYDVVYNLHNKGHEVTVLAINTPKHFQNQDVLQSIAKLETVFIDTSISAFKAFKNLFSHLPYNFERFISSEFKEKINSILKNNTFDIIQIEGAQIACYVDDIKKMCKIPVVFRSHNIEYKIWQRLSENEPIIIKKLYLKLLANRIKNYEYHYIKRFDHIISISEIDSQELKKMAPNVPITTIPAGINIKKTEQNLQIQPKTLFILSALNWHPNLQAVEWFLKSVWPEVKRKCPEITLHIAGKHTPEHILKLTLKDVYIHGFVEDANAFMQKYELMLVPLLSGSGMRLKIVQGMYLNKCILTSSIGAEGIDCTNNENILLRNQASEWIEIIEEYYHNKIKINEIAEKAHEFAKNKYNNELLIEKFIDVYRNLI